MKKIILAMSLMLAISLPSALAIDEKEVDPRVLATFKMEFSSARDVQWNVNADHTTAKFSLYDQGFTAYFTNEGELIGTARNILYVQLPLSVIKEIENSFAKAEITSVTEFTLNGETSYYLHATQKGKKLLLQAFSSGQVSIVKKIKQ